MSEFKLGCISCASQYGPKSVYPIFMVCTVNPSSTILGKLYNSQKFHSKVQSDVIVRRILYLLQFNTNVLSDVNRDYCF